jgi:hypothetical protein
VRYFLPVAPAPLGTTLAAAVSGWHRRSDRPALATAAALTVAGAAITGHLVRTVIVRLFDDRLPDDERNAVRPRYRSAGRPPAHAPAGRAAQEGPPPGTRPHAAHARAASRIRPSACWGSIARSSSLTAFRWSSLSAAQ